MGSSNISELGQFETSKLGDSDAEGSVVLIKMGKEDRI